MQAPDNLVWTALTTYQARFSEGGELARRFQPEVTAFAAVKQETTAAFRELAALVRPGQVARLLPCDPSVEIPGFARLHQFDIATMMQEKVVDGLAQLEMRPLGAEHNSQMLALTRLTEPGPFGTRTHELGNYFGIFDGERLVAMAGERLHVPGYAEVSAVCTHPDYTGRGYAATLVAAAGRRIRERGETPFLRVREDNKRAIKVYERIGFVIAHVKPILVVRKPE